ncbi:peptidase C12, ubiquitin carboxyl-terminal hydrolase 1 [Clavulina sp. PMI_390]|nr:peptidase C12, ubiquitin carboxyl-terminal hydrolase 1 [Clavulina sp. PMI_390]
MNKWASLLGMDTKEDEFSDVYGLDPELLSLVPQPSKALIMCFPITEKLQKAEDEADQAIAEKGQSALDPGLLYIKQTIGNACGTMALLHAIANAKVTIAPNSPLAKFFEEIKPLDPMARSEALTRTTLFADAHSSAASQGQSSVPNAEDDVDLHFVAFVAVPVADEEPKPAAESSSGETMDVDSATSEKKDKGKGKATEEDDSVESAKAAGTEKKKKSKLRLVELDGRRAGPVDHGSCSDLLSAAAKVIKDKFIPHSTSQNFGLLSLGPPAY